MVRFCVVCVAAVCSLSTLVAAFPVIEKRVDQIFDEFTAQWVQACKAAGGGNECDTLVAASPITKKRTDQTFDESTEQWVQACKAAGGGNDCNNISVNAFDELSADTQAPLCGQQDGGDNMVDLAKKISKGGQPDPDMIRLAQIFIQQPRNTPDNKMVPYCQTPPRNAELAGYYQCQFASPAKSGVYSGDKTATTPLGLGAPVSPAGSCPAYPSGPVPNGKQLVDLVKVPGTPVGGGAGAGSSASAGTSSPAGPTISGNEPALSATGAAQSAGAGSSASAGTSSLAGPTGSGNGTVPSATGAAQSAGAGGKNSAGGKKGAGGAGSKD